MKRASILLIVVFLFLILFGLLFTNHAHHRDSENNLPPSPAVSRIPYDPNATPDNYVERHDYFN